MAVVMPADLVLFGLMGAGLAATALAIVRDHVRHERPVLVVLDDDPGNEPDGFAA